MWQRVIADVACFATELHPVREGSQAVIVLFACWAFPAAFSLQASVEASDGEDADTVCVCNLCKGGQDLTRKRLNGALGTFTCKSKNTSICKQEGNMSTWVVQTMAALPTHRFCRYTCKPIIKMFTGHPTVCSGLSAEEIVKAQTPSGDGVALTWQNNPMTDSLPLRELVPYF